MFERISNLITQGDKTGVFIESPHRDPERRGFNFEYQKDFADFFEGVLREANFDFDLEVDLKKYLDFLGGKGPTTLASVGSAYIHASASVARILNNQVTLKYGDSSSASVFQKYLDNDQVDAARKNILGLLVQFSNIDLIKHEDVKADLKLTDNMPARVNSCVMAEKNMLAYVSGKHTKINGGFVNVIVNEKEEPIMLEKMGLGESNSCITLAPVRLGGKYIPAGSLMQSLDFSDEMLHFERNAIRKKIRWFSKQKGGINYVKTLDEYEGFKFVRFSILSVPPEIRSDACGGYFLHQQDKTNGYINYDWLTPDILGEYASSRIKNRNSQGLFL